MVNDSLTSDDFDEAVRRAATALGGRPVGETTRGPRAGEQPTAPESSDGDGAPTKGDELLSDAEPDFAYVPAPQPLIASKRQADYMRRAADVHRELRRERLRQLRDRKSAIQRATAACAALREEERYWIVLRTAFIWVEPGRPARPDDVRIKEDVQTRPPLTRVLYERNPYALALYLAGLYVTQMLAERHHETRGRRRQDYVPDVRPNVFGSNETASWVTLAGLAQEGVKPSDRRRRLSRALDALSRNGLVSLGRGNQRYSGFGWNSEDGGGSPYRDPFSLRGDAVALYLPPEFFTSGWHLVLTPSELATYLVVAHMTDRAHGLVSGERRRGQIFLPESVRWSRFGLSGEAYETIHELDEFGLLRVTDPMPNRRRGRVRPQSADGAAQRTPYRLLERVSGGDPSSAMLFDLAFFDRSAFDVVSECLSRHSVPRRFR